MKFDNRPIDWGKITEQYDQMVKYATALRLGTTETEQMLRRFTKGSGPKSPVYLAIETRAGDQHDLCPRFLRNASRHIGGVRTSAR
jgi:hypothetical protein